MKTYQVNDVVQFMGDEYKVVEVLQMEDALHIKKTSAPFNSMVVPVVKLENTPNATTIQAMLEAVEIIENESARFSSPEELIDALNSPTQEEADAEIQDVLDFSVKPDLLYRPDNKFSL